MDVPLHSKIKHRIIGYYFPIVKKVFSSFYSYYYIDLYSGDGICKCRDIPPHILPILPKDFKTEWRPPFFSLLDYNKEEANHKFVLNCFFNDSEISVISELDKLLQPYKDKVKITLSNKDANHCVKESIGFIGKPNRPSLFYLDPFNHADLKFSTIKEISEFKDENSGRKPELITNLMVYSMLQAIQRGRQQDLDSITESLGTVSWKAQLNYFKDNNKTHELFRDVFIEQLKKLGYYCTWYSVKSIKCNAPQYYIIFCTYNEKIYSIHKNMEQNIKKLQQEKWIAESWVVDWMITHIGKGQKQLLV